jgi:nucleoside-diphosphate-sugar epimerase
MVYVDDVAATYEAALHATFEGAHTLNLTGHAVSMDEVIQTIRRIVPQADIRCEGPVIPSSASAPNEFGHGLLALGRERSLHEGIALTIAHYTPSVEAGT